MPKLPLSPFLLDPNAEPPVPEPRTGACADHAPVPGRRGAMDLDAAELFVIATLRAWVAPRMRPGDAHPDWRELFRMAGAGAPAIIAFDGLMSVIGAQAKRLIDVHCCRCPSLGEDETLMLRLVAALQAGETLPALAILGDWLPEEATGPALLAARRFALSIAETGLSLPRRGQVLPFPASRTLH
ncbi:MAG: hypothetical protein K2X49_26075 [Acetobacteraceae bacterium]|nr:hypothetical protein [Acetobacteraceae bacterium]